MIVNSECWDNIPLLHIYNDEINNDSPIIIFLHGFESAKEHNLHYAYRLVNQGYRVLLPDAHLHGEREEKLDEVEISLRFWEIVLTSIEEVGKLKHELITRGYWKNQKIGLAGTSMGGITTLGCLTVYPWVDASAIMMGTPGYVQLAKAQIAGYEQKGFHIPLNEEEKENMFRTLSKFDATYHIEKLADRPMFFWHGEKDAVVPFTSTAEFIKEFTEQYGSKNLVFMKEKSAGHAVSRKGLLAATKWLADNLA
ncbi:prolyl oligopeptidase family serine peptidase [Psychrobacillus vulpis]|uniref:Esterase n=1 Tax=Psychrobacillus vulpis TaxID=2325572 RepID=A0A544TS03_9BACI|nr:prolyl oligopeptidase family serine peptidase [Psychrobacillus vulpis]TQR20237.1 esterase [Psychrobacillus vulpis]